MITKIGLINFRGRENRELIFYPNRNLLTGVNESGKSTLKEAIAFAWYGTDSAGFKNPDHLITIGSDHCEVVLETEHVTVARRKKRGATSTIKLTRKGYPPVTLTQTELQAMLKLTVHAFNSLWLAGHFMSLDTATQLAVLSELAQLDRRALFVAILPAGTTIPSTVKLNNPKLDADAVAGQRRSLQNMRESDSGALKQLEAQLSQLQGAEAVDIESYGRALNEVNARLDAWDFYNKALSKYQHDRLRFGEAINRKGSLTAEKLALRLPSHHDLKTMASQVEELKGKVAKAHADLHELPAKQAHPQPPKKPLVLAAGTVCDRCGQKVDEMHGAALMAAYEKELLHFNKLDREVADHNAQVVRHMTRIEEELTARTFELSQAEQDHTRAVNAAENGKAHLQRIQEQLDALAQLKEPVAPERPPGDEQALRQEQLSISTALNLARRQATQVDGLLAQQKLLRDSIATKTMQIEEASRVEKALLSLPLIETERLLDGLKVSGVTATLSDGKLLVTGPRDVPYHSMSSGRRMKVDVEFCRSLRKVAGSRAPSWIFIDNADLVDRFHEDALPRDVQIFLAKVDAGMMNLTIHELV
jgi:DNA repair exonuclease SbcCD ATPase subunit